MVRHMVVAAYNESVAWVLSALETGKVDRVFVYNKGRATLRFDDPRVEVMAVPNVGREGETFLRHIMENYSSLPDALWFVQGGPFEHSPEFLGLVGAVEDYGSSGFKSMSDRWKTMESVPPPWMRDATDAFRVRGLRCADYFVKDMQLVGHCAFPDEGIKNITALFRDRYGTDDYFGYLSDRLGIDRPLPITRFAYGACFYASASGIRRRPVEVYEAARDFLMEGGDQGGFQGYILERFWPYLLTGTSYGSIHECYADMIPGREALVWDVERRRATLVGPAGFEVSQNPTRVVCYLEEGVVRSIAGIEIAAPSPMSFECPTLDEAAASLLRAR